MNLFSCQQNAGKLEKSASSSVIAIGIFSILEYLSTLCYQSLLCDSGVKAGGQGSFSWEKIGHNLSCSPQFLNAHLQFALLEKDCVIKCLCAGPASKFLTM